MNKKILNADQIKEVAKLAIEMIAEPVKATLGPGGRPILIQRQGQYPDGSPLGPLVTKDGVTVAENVNFKDPNLDTVAKAIIQVAQKTVNEGGDGPQPLNSKVLTPTGFVEMQDLKVGMEICGTNGTVQKVLGIFPKGNKQLCEVHFSSGRVVECCPEHLWTVTQATDYSVKTKTTKELLKDFSKQTTPGHTSYKYYTPVSEVEFYSNKSEMPLDPYLVGCLLGDGSLTGTGSIEFSLGFSKEHIIDKINLPKGLKVNVNRVDKKNYLRVEISGVDEKGRTAKRLVESLGLLGSSSKTKFIPKSYLFSSLKDRKSLLQGIVDTECYVNKKGLIEFSSVSKELAEDFETLLRSLGKSVHKTLHTRESDLDSNTPIYKITELKGYEYGDKILDIKVKSEKVPMQCIKVSNKDQLYFTDGFVTTHNTSTSIVLAESIYKAGLKYVEQGENNIQLYSALQNLTEEIIEIIDKDIKQKIDSEEALKNVAKISANGDEEIAKIVVDAINASGEDGYVALEESSSRDTHLEVVEGAVYKMGWRQFAPNGSLQVTDKARNVAEYEKAAICIYGGKLDDVHKVADFINRVMKFDENRNELTDIFPVVFVALDYSDEVKQMILKQKMLAKLPVSAVKIAGDGSPNHRTQMLHDLAVITGATVGARSLLDFEDMNEEHLGGVDKITIEPDQTIFFGGAGDKEEIKNRIDELNTLLDTTNMSPFDQDNVRLRKGKLSGGVAIVKVGGTSELEMKEKKDRIEDALCAAKVAVKDGIVPGGGKTLLNISNALPTDTVAKKILKNALQEPFKQIIRNIGEIPEVALMQLKGKDLTIGYDASKREVVDLLEAGIVDPAIVTKSALRNAVSISGLLLTTGGALIRDDSDQNLTDGAPNPLAALMGGS